jgi:hypothetical protein
LSGVFTNASASDDFTIRFKMAGVTLHSVARVGGNETNAGWDIVARITVRTDGVSGQYVDYFKYMENQGNIHAAGHTSGHSLDTTTSNTLSITFQWDNAKSGNTFSTTQGYVTFNH